MECELVPPAEDTIQALIDQLVLPLLPLKPCYHDSPAPSLSEQKDVGAQMHAVVLLYNYYHKKRYPVLEFLSFESFCQMAVIATPSLLTYMANIKRYSQEENYLSGQFSVAENMMIDACNICKALDPSRDTPNTDGWPVCKVAVLLVDSTTEKCLLQFSSVTKGVWSLIERDTDAPLYAKEHSGNAMLQQVAFSVVKDGTGIEQTDLKILETHSLYSLSKEKSIAQFYIMQCTEVGDRRFTSIDYLISCLEGPVVTNGLDTFETTTVVEYFHLLPYVGIVSDWFHRKNISGDPRLLEEDTVEISGNGNQNEQTVTIESKASGSYNVKRADDHSNVELGSTEVEIATCGEMSDCIDNVKFKVVSPTQKGRASADNSLPSHSRDLIVQGAEVRGMQSIIPERPMDQGKTHLTLAGSKAVKDGFEEKALASSSRPNDFELDGKFKGGKGICSCALPSCSRHPDPVPPREQELKSRPLSQNSEDIPNPLNLEYSLNHRSLEEIQEKMALKVNDLLKMGMQALHIKHDELCQQQRHVEEIIAHCERNLQTTFCGGDDLQFKLELVVQAYNVACAKGVCHTCVASPELLLPQSIKRRRLSEENPTLQL